MIDAQPHMPGLSGVDPLLHNLQDKLPQAWVPEDFA
jgi:hypothetical protein